MNNQIIRVYENEAKDIIIYERINRDNMNEGKYFVTSNTLIYNGLEFRTIAQVNLLIKNLNK